MDLNLLERREKDSEAGTEWAMGRAREAELPEVGGPQITSRPQQSLGRTGYFLRRHWRVLSRGSMRSDFDFTEVGSLGNPLPTAAAFPCFVLQQQEEGRKKPLCVTKSFRCLSHRPPRSLLTVIGHHGNKQKRTLGRVLGKALCAQHLWYLLQNDSTASRKKAGLSWF